MEALVLSHHQNGYRSSINSEIAIGYDSSPYIDFVDINCRTSESGLGMLSSPFSSRSPSATHKISVSSQSPSATSKLSFSSPQSPGQNRSLEENDEPKALKKTQAIPITSKRFESRSAYNDELPYYELWAGPTYSNSPPPSSLPIPKFSLMQKRSVSLDLPSTSIGIEILPAAKSAPSSPTRESHSSASRFLFSTASATEDLRRILHLDISDDVASTGSSL